MEVNETVDEVKELHVVRIRRFWKDSMSPGLGRRGSVAMMDS